MIDTGCSTRFSKESRLLGPQNFSPVFEKPDFRVSTRHLLILAKKTDQSLARLGIVVAKRNVRKAVERNRIKRIFRECFRTRKAELATLDLVFLARAHIDTLTNREVRQTADKLLDELFKRSMAQRSQ